MICIHPTTTSNTQRIQELECATGMTSYQVPGRTYAVLATPNVFVFPKAKARKKPTQGGWTPGGNAA